MNKKQAQAAKRRAARATAKEGLPHVGTEAGYSPETWTPAQLLAHRAGTLETAFAKASCLAGGWYGRAVTIDWQVTTENDERYMIRPSEIPALDGWAPCYEVTAVRS